MHFQDFEALERPTPPPVTLASRQLRDESLTLFYSACELNILSEYEHDLQPSDMWTGDRWQLGAAAAVFAKAPQVCLDNLRYIMVTLKISETMVWTPFYVRHADSPWYMQWSVDLGLEEEDKVEVEVEREDWENDNDKLYSRLSDANKQHVDTFDERMTQLFITIGSRAEGKRLRREDLAIFEKVFQK